MKKKISLLIIAIATLVSSSCSFNEGQETLTGASAVVGSRSVIGAEVDVFGWRRIGAGIWLQKPLSSE